MEGLIMDTTWSVRIPEELKEKLSLLISESGQNSKDFINQLVQLYTLKETGKIHPIINIDIEELTQLTGRINNIFINLFEKISSFQRQREDEYNTQLEEKNEMLAVFSGKIKEQEDRSVGFENETLELKQQYEEIRVQHDRLLEAYEVNKALVSEYKEKNDTLSSLLVEYKEYKTALFSAKAAIDEEKDLRIAVETKLLNAEMEVSAIKKSIEEERIAFEIKLQRQTERLELNNERLILEINKDFQQKMQSEQEMYAAKVKDLLSKIEDIQQSKSGKKSSATKVGINKNL